MRARDAYAGERGATLSAVLRPQSVVVLAVATAMAVASLGPLRAHPAPAARHRTRSDTSSTTTSTTGLAAATPEATDVEFYEPWDGDRLDPSLHIAGTLSGSCFAGSIPVDDPDAWRCLSGDRILDPCFAPPGDERPSELACGSPWTEVTLLRLEEDLPHQAANRALAPSAGWLLQLANGARCSLTQGASGRTDGISIAYLCSSGAAAGPLDWSEEPWTVRYVATASRGAQRVAVAIAWGG